MSEARDQETHQEKERVRVGNRCAPIPAVKNEGLLGVSAD